MGGLAVVRNEAGGDGEIEHFIQVNFQRGDTPRPYDVPRSTTITYCCSLIRSLSNVDTRPELLDNSRILCDVISAAIWHSFTVIPS